MLSQLLCVLYCVWPMELRWSVENPGFRHAKVPFPWVFGQCNRKSRCVPLVQCSINFTKDGKREAKQERWWICSENDGVCWLGNLVGCWLGLDDLFVLSADLFQRDMVMGFMEMKRFPCNHCSPLTSCLVRGKSSVSHLVECR